MSTRSDGALREIRDSLRSIGASVQRQAGRLDQIESDLRGIAEVQTDHGRKLISYDWDLAQHGEKLTRIISLLQPPDVEQ